MIPWWGQNLNQSSKNLAEMRGAGCRTFVKVRLWLKPIHLLCHLQEGLVAALPSGAIHSRLFLQLLDLFSHLQHRGGDSEVTDTDTQTQTQTHQQIGIQVLRQGESRTIQFNYHWSIDAPETFKTNCPPFLKSLSMQSSLIVSDNIIITNKQQTKKGRWKKHRFNLVTIFNLTNQTSAGLSI